MVVVVALELLAQLEQLYKLALVVLVQHHLLAVLLSLTQVVVALVDMVLPVLSQVLEALEVVVRVA